MSIKMVYCYTTKPEEEQRERKKRRKEAEGGVGGDIRGKGGERGRKLVMRN